MGRSLALGDPPSYCFDVTTCAWPARAMVYSLFAVTLAVNSAHAQDAGSGARRLAGGALGVTAGAVAGNVASILPCTQTPLGGRCVGGATILGGAVGLVSGVLVGGSDEGRLADRATTGLVGFVIGSTMAFTGRPFLQRVGLADVFTVGIVGGAIGTQPMGAFAGLGVGTALGVALRVAVPGFETPDVAAAAVAGLMMGVLVGWVSDAADARAAGSESVPLFTVAWRL